MFISVRVRVRVRSSHLLSCNDCFHVAISGLKNKGGFQKLQDSWGPFGLRGVTFSRGIWISKKEKPFLALESTNFQKKSACGMLFNLTLLVNFKNVYLQKALLHF